MKKKIILYCVLINYVVLWPDNEVVKYDCGELKTITLIQRKQNNDLDTKNAYLVGGIDFVFKVFYFYLSWFMNFISYIKYIPYAILLI